MLTRPTARRRSTSKARRCSSDSDPIRIMSSLLGKEPELNHANPCLSFGNVLRRSWWAVARQPVLGAM
jgi:hypothetical protein